MMKAVIFDMDGVLIDSVQLGVDVRKKLLAQYDVDLDTVPDPQGEGHRAASLKTLLASVEKHSGVHIDQGAFARQSIAAMEQAFSKGGTSADPALVSFLEDLKSHGITCAIASSGLREGVAIKLEALGIQRYFSVIVTGSDVTEHKPHPRPYQYTLAKLRLPPQDCVIIEDSLTGIQAGQAAGCRVIGFTQYQQSSEPLPGATLTVRSWAEVSYDRLQNLNEQ